jgi:integrase
MPKLTTEFVRKTKPTDRDQFFWESRLSGFGLRVKPSGVKSFLIQYRNSSGQSKRKTIGRFGDPLTVDQAFRAARKELAAVTLGEDPVSKQREERNAWTVNQLCEIYLKEAAAGNVLTRRREAKSASTMATDIGRVKRHITPLLGSKRVQDLKRADIQRFFGDVKAGRTAVNEKTGEFRGRAIVTGGQGTAKRTVGLLSGILSYAVEIGIIEDNPARGIRLPKDQKREIFNLDEKYHALGNALRLAEERGEPWQAIGIIRLCALSGLRRGEAVNLKWTEVDLDGGCIRLAASKTGFSVRPVGNLVTSLLAEIKSQNASNHFVFTASRVEDASFGGIPRAWKRITGEEELSSDNKQELESLTLHGLRHGFATTADNLGLTLPSVAALLGHSVGGVTAGYIGRVDSFLSAAADRVANQIAQTMGDAVTNLVIERPRFGMTK